MPVFELWSVIPQLTYLIHQERRKEAEEEAKREAARTLAIRNERIAMGLRGETYFLSPGHQFFHDTDDLNCYIDSGDLVHRIRKMLDP